MGRRRRLPGPAPLNEHNLAQYVVSQHEAGPEQGIGCRFEMTSDATDQMKLSPISLRVDESNCDGTFLLVRLMLDRDHVIDSREELLHILARSAAMDILRRADRALIRMRAIHEQIGESKKGRGQLQTTRFARKELGEKSRIFEIIGRVVGDLQDSSEDLCAWNASDRQTRLSDDVIGAAFGQLLPVPRSTPKRPGLRLGPDVTPYAGRLPVDR